GLQGSHDPQDESRLETLAELVSVAAEFEAQMEEADALASEYEEEGEPARSAAADAPAGTPPADASAADGAPEPGEVAGADIAPDAALNAPDDPEASLVDRFLATVSLAAEGG